MRLAYILSDQPGATHAVLRALADNLSAAGKRPVGAVQIVPEPESGGSCGMELALLPDRQRVDISQSLGSGATGCRLDTSALENAVELCARRLAEGADLLIVNKFGHREADGGGFRELIGAALAADVPVIVGTSPDRIAAFLDYAGGLATRLPCAESAVLDWLCNEAPADRDVRHAEDAPSAATRI